MILDTWYDKILYGKFQKILSQKTCARISRPIVEAEKAGLLFFVVSFGHKNQQSKLTHLSFPEFNFDFG